MRKGLLFTLLASLLAISTYAQPDNELIRSLAEPELQPFYHGVASGDPTPSAVIIWTRVTPEVDGPVEVTWRIGSDAQFTDTLQEGTIITGPDVDYTVKVDVGGLQPGTWYYYEFHALGRNSQVGRTKTAPSGGVDQLRFAVVSCSNYPVGYFNVYEKIYERNDVDAVLHLGDYIYEGGGSSILHEDMPRSAPPNHELISLNDYRIRHSAHKLDSDSRKMHQNYPLIAVWDDHESADNSWRDGSHNHDPATEGTWADRKAAAMEAYYEWMPLRKPDPGNFTRIFRKLSYGNLLDLFMLDTRLYDRDEQSVPNQFDNPDRKLIGPEQMNWLLTGLANSTATYKVLGQQVVMAPFIIPNYGTGTYVTLNNDQWDGYTADRTELYDFILEADIDNVVVLTGDVHTAWANDLPYDVFNYNGITGAGSVAVEFVCNSVTSTSVPVQFPVGFYGVIKLILPYIKFIEFNKKGYCVLDLNAGRAQGDFYAVNTIEEPYSGEWFQQGWYTNDGENHLRKAQGPSHLYGPQQPLAPDFPRDQVDSTVTAIQNLQFDVLGIYPNPFINDVLMEVHLFHDANVSLSLVDMKGAIVASKDYGHLPRGRNLVTLNKVNVPGGDYILMLNVGDDVISRKVMKLQE